MSVAIWFPATTLVQGVRMNIQLAHGAQLATIKIDLDLGPLTLTSEQLEHQLNEIFRAIFAPLLPQSVVVTQYGYQAITLGAPNIAFVPELLTGSLIALASDIDESAVVLSYAGGFEHDAVRRWYLPFIPTSYVSGGVITAFGQEQILTRLRGLYLGCDGQRGGFGPRLIIFHPARPATPRDAGRDAEYAVAEQLVLCTYVDRAPAL